MTACPAPSDEIAFALKRLASLVPLDGHDQALLQDAARVSHIVPARGEILAEGKPIRQAFILLDGWAYRARILSDGRRQILHMLLPGDLVGMCSHSNPTAMTEITALTNVVLCPAPPSRAGQVGEGLAEAYALSRAHEEGYLLRQITRLGRLSAYERIVDWIVELDERLVLAGLDCAAGFHLPATQETIADMLGLTSVHVNRMLQSMRRDGYLRIDSGIVKVLDRGRCLLMADYSRPATSAASILAKQLIPS
jgi:CRP-like cAMP-binding protein